MSAIPAVRDEITEAVGRAVLVALGYQRGDVIPWAAIERVSFVRETTHWTAFRKRFGAALLYDHGLTLCAVSGVGLRLDTAEQQVRDRSARRRRFASRQLARDAAELAATPDVILTQDLKDEKYRRLDASRKARRGVLAAERAAKALTHNPNAGLFAKPLTTN